MHNYSEKNNYPKINFKFCNNALPAFMFSLQLTTHVLMCEAFHERFVATTSLDMMIQPNWNISQIAVVTLSFFIMLQVQKFLCYFSLEIGGFVIGWSGLVMSIIAVVIELFVAIYVSFSDCEIYCEDNRTGRFQ